MTESPPQAFKTAWFAKAAKKALIKDAELCEAFAEILKGQCEDLGGGVYKKCLDKNRHRSIVLAKGQLNWIYQFLFAKKTATTSMSKSSRVFESQPKTTRNTLQK